MSEPVVRLTGVTVAYRERAVLDAVDVDTGMPMQDLRPNNVVIIEKWSDVPALKEHLAQTHMATYREAVKDFVRGVRLQVLRPAG